MYTQFELSIKLLFTASITDEVGKVSSNVGSNSSKLSIFYLT